MLVATVGDPTPMLVDSSKSDSVFVRQLIVLSLSTISVDLVTATASGR